MKNKLPMVGAIAMTICLTFCLWQPSSAQEAVTEETSAETTSESSGEEVSVPEETSSGETIPTRNLLLVLRDGGILMIPIALCSFILCVFIFERAISLRRGRVVPPPFVKRFTEQLSAGELDQAEAIKLCEENKSHVAEVFAAAAKKWGRPEVEVEQATIDQGERVSNSLRSYLRLFNGISTISPLLGLLGTVLGMIRAFNAVASSNAMGRPELLATGISQALLTTAAGLSVAIPALVAYLYFVSRVDQRLIDIDNATQDVVALISAEAKKTSGRRKAA